MKVVSIYDTSDNPLELVGGFMLVWFGLTRDCNNLVCLYHYCPIGTYSIVSFDNIMHKNDFPKIETSYSFKTSMK